MSQNKFPKGSDDQRVRRIVDEYEKQTEDEAVAEDEAGVASSDVVMSVPRELVETVRELIAKRKG